MSKTAKQPVRLSVETFEERDNPSSSIDGYGNLVVYGTAGPDTVKVEYQAARYSGGWYMPAKLNVIENGSLAASWTASRVTGHIGFVGGGGNDYFNNWADNWRVVADGQEGNDTLIGYGKDDYLDGGLGDDLLMGYGGQDTLLGGPGVDTLQGMAGNDYLVGGADWMHDVLEGGAGYDTFERDSYWTGTYWYNFDAAQDYNPSYDVYNGGYLNY